MPRRFDFLHLFCPKMGCHNRHQLCEPAVTAIRPMTKLQIIVTGFFSRQCKETLLPGFFRCVNFCVIRFFCFVNFSFESIADLQDEIHPFDNKLHHLASDYVVYFEFLSVIGFGWIFSGLLTSQHRTHKIIIDEGNCDDDDDVSLHQSKKKHSLLEKKTKN